jgi:hypothetical protein
MAILDVVIRCLPAGELLEESDMLVSNERC